VYEPKLTYVLIHIFVKVASLPNANPLTLDHRRSCELLVTQVLYYQIIYLFQ